jgi:hypothetical protein
MSGSTSRRLAGIVSFTVDGDTWDVVGPLEYQPTDVTVETIKGQSRVEGYGEMPEAGAISAKLRDQGSAALAALGAKRSATVIAVAANGKTVYGAGMWRVGPPLKANTQDGTFDIEFNSDSVTESTV